jgi:hypothetical protein
MTSNNDETMKAALAEVIAKAARDPAAYSSLEFVYQRGHEMSGITRFELRTNGRFELTASDPTSGSMLTFARELDPTQRAAVLSALDEAHVLQIPAPARPIGDGELPIVIELSYEHLHARVLVWADDVAEIEPFGAFETKLEQLFQQLSDGHLRRLPR